MAYKNNILQVGEYTKKQWFSDAGIIHRLFKFCYK